MAIRDILKSLLPNLADDGSRELAQNWADLLDDAGEITALLSNPAFQKILGRLRNDFRGRMLVLVNNDPELKAMHKMFIRTVGLAGAKEQIEKTVEELMEEPIESSG